MNLQNTNFEQSTLLKELGFDVYTDTYYYKGEESSFTDDWRNWNSSKEVHSDNYATMTTIALALRWIEESFGIFGSIDINPYYSDNPVTGKRTHERSYTLKIYNKENQVITSAGNAWVYCDARFKTYESVESEMLTWILNYLKNNLQN